MQGWCWIPIVATLVVAPAMAAVDLEAGKAKAATVCAACHGANGVSVADHIPNLAGQRSAYLVAQLEAFKDGSRKSDIMNVMAPQLSDADIANVAAHFAAQPGAPAGAKSALLANVAATHVTLPASFRVGYTRYLTKDSVEAGQVSLYWANDAAFAAAAGGQLLPDGSAIYIESWSAKKGADGKPLVGSDGHLVADRLRSVSAMASGTAWGADIPEMLRNGNWNYALFSADRTLRTEVNQAECLACHKPKASSSYLFLQRELAAAAAARK
jgi:cytochrome c553